MSFQKFLQHIPHLESFLKVIILWEVIYKYHYEDNSEVDTEKEVNIVFIK